MRRRFDEQGGPDLRVVAAEYRDAMRKRLRWLGPLGGGLVLLILLLTGLYSVEPGEVGVVRTFGRMSGMTDPGLHFAVPIVQKVEVINLAQIRQIDIGFRSQKDGTSKIVPAEAQMLTGDENIVAAEMIVQYQVADPEKYLFRLKDPETALRIAAEVALRSVVGTMRVTSVGEPSPGAETVESLPEVKKVLEEAAAATEAAEGKAAEGKEGEEPAPEGEAPPEAEPKAPPPAPTASASAPSPPEPAPGEGEAAASDDILTSGRARAEVATKQLLIELMEIYESGIRITEVKLQTVDAPDEVKDAFHDVVRAREELQQLINKALGYREDRIPRARGEAQKIMRAAEGYKRERVLRAQGEAAAFEAVLEEYEKAKGVTRERLHLEVMERVLGGVTRKVFIDEGVAKNALPFLPIGAVAGATGQGGQP
jgi:membrane protease subunit HflK